MDEQIITQPPTPPPPPVTVMPTTPKKGMSLWPVLIIALVAAYSVYASYSGMWPFAAKVVVSPTPTLSPSVSATPDTTGWQTYADTQYGFEMKYPVGWSIVKNPNYYGGGVIPAGETPYAIVYGAEPTSAGNGTFAIFYVGTKPTGGYSYPSEYGLFSSTAGQDAEAIALQIFSTFKFTNPTVGWETYTNAQHGFSVKMPLGYLAEVSGKSPDITVTITHNHEPEWPPLIISISSASIDSVLSAIQRQWDPTAPAIAADSTIDGALARNVSYFSEIGASSHYTVFAHGGRTFTIEWYDGTEQSLSTFKFTK